MTSMGHVASAFGSSAGRPAAGSVSPWDELPPPPGGAASVSSDDGRGRAMSSFHHAGAMAGAIGALGPPPPGAGGPPGEPPPPGSVGGSDHGSFRHAGAMASAVGAFGAFGGPPGGGGGVQGAAGGMPNSRSHTISSLRGASAFAGMMGQVRHKCFVFGLICVSRLYAASSPMFAFLLFSVAAFNEGRARPHNVCWWNDACHTVARHGATTTATAW